MAPITIKCGKCHGTFKSGEEFSAHPCAIASQIGAQRPATDPRPER